MGDLDNTLRRGSTSMTTSMIESETSIHVLQLDVGVRSEEMITLRIFVPELTISKVFQSHKDDLIWNVKQQCLATLPKELKEGFNYGLFSPPSNGRAGKFLDEERPLLDYAFHGPEAYLELKYKRRVYKMLNLDEKQLRALHTRVNLRRFLEYVSSGNVEKVTKMCYKGLDPNFHCQESGETPLTIAAASSKSSQQLLMALVGGGALLDYRTKCGSTSLHRAAEKGRTEAVRTLLDLGASPNMRDGKGYTAIYLAVATSAPAAVCLSLLYDHSILGVTDSQGWQEVHQACRNGLVQHLENLLFYGADMNGRNASGNTPLHVCAVNNQEACARLLLFRGCLKDALNYANQSPFQVAVIAGNQSLAELISKFKEEDVVLFKEQPTYNSRRRKSGVSRYSKDFRLSAPNTPSSSCSPHTPTASVTHILSSSAVRVLPPLSSSGYGSISGSSSGVPPSPCPSERGWTDNHALSTSSASSCTADSEDGGSANGSSITDKSIADQSDRVSDSSGVGTSHSGSAGSNDATPTDTSLTISLYPEGMTVVCTEAYEAVEEGHLGLQPGDIIEVTGSTDHGFLEGRLRGMFGLFPPSHVQEVRLRNPYAIAAAQHHPMMGGSLGSSHSPLRMRTPSPSITNNERRDLLINQFGTLQRVRRMFSEPRTVILHKGLRGFGFVLRGAKSSTPVRGASPMLDGRFPGLQYLESVDPGSVADKAGLKTGDFLLAINGEDVSQASHEAVVAAIQCSGNLVTMTVCSHLTQPEVINCSSLPPTPADQGPSRQCVTLPRKFQGRPPQPPRRDPRTTLSVGRAKAKSLLGGLAAMNAADLGPRPEVIYASTDLKTASIRPRPSSTRMSTSEELFRLGPAPVPPVQAPKSSRVYASVSAMKRVKKQKTAISNDTHLHKIFYSTPDLAWETDLGGSQSTLTPSWSNANSPDTQLATPSGPPSLPHDWRKSQSHENVTNIYAMNVKNTRHSWAVTMQQRSLIDRGYDDAWKDLEHSQTDGTSESDEDALTPVNDLSDHSPVSVRSNDKCDDTLLGVSEYRAVMKPCRPVGGTLPRRVQSPALPPPTNPPPPVPASQVVMVDVSKGCSEYASLTISSPKTDKSAFSSFRPDGSKVYASPEKLGTLRKSQGTLATRSKSLPLKSPKPSVPVRNGDEMSASLTEATMNNSVQCQNLSNSVYDQPINAVNDLPFIPEPDYESDSEQRKKRVESRGTLQGPVYMSSVQLRSSEVMSPPRVVEESLRPVSEGRRIFDAKIRNAKDYKEPNENIYVTFVPVKPNDEKQNSACDIPQLTRVTESLIETEIESDSSENTIMSRGNNDRGSKHEDSSSSISTLSSGSLPSDHIGTLEIPVKFDSDDVNTVKKFTEHEIDNEIERSLEMIRLHVSSMQEVQQPSPKPSCLYRGSNPPLPPLPDYDDENSPTDDFLPPPPAEFCDITSGIKSSFAPPLPPPPTLKQLNDDFLRGRPKPKMERRLSEENFRPNARVVGIVPKKVSFHPEVTMCDPFPKQAEKFYGTLPTNFSRGYRMRAIENWSVQDVCEWLDSLSLSEYKSYFSRHNINGDKLIELTDEDLNDIGVRNVSHRVHIETSLLRYKKD